MNNEQRIHVENEILNLVHCEALEISDLLTAIANLLTAGDLLIGNHPATVFVDRLDKHIRDAADEAEGLEIEVAIVMGIAEEEEDEILIATGNLEGSKS